MHWRLLSRGLLAAGLWLTGTVVFAAGLQVAPIQLSFSPSSPAQGLWLTNTGDEVLRAQVRVYQWTQDDGNDELTPTQSLIASPPMLNLEPGARQLVRVIRTEAATAGTQEYAFRLLVDELPEAAASQESAIRYVLRYSLPVFIESIADAPDVATIADALTWSWLRDGDDLALQIHNAGHSHAQLSDVSLLPVDGMPVTVSAGLLGYVLPDMTMRWNVNVPEEALRVGTQIKARINGKPIKRAVAVGELLD